MKYRVLRCARYRDGAKHDCSRKGKLNGKRNQACGSSGNPGAGHQNPVKPVVRPGGLRLPECSDGKIQCLQEGLAGNLHHDPFQSAGSAFNPTSMGFPKRSATRAASPAGMPRFGYSQIANVCFGELILKICLHSLIMRGGQGPSPVSLISSGQSAVGSGQYKLCLLPLPTAYYPDFLLCPFGDYPIS